MDALAGATTKIKRVPREEYKLDFGPDTRDTTECFEVDLKVYKIAELILGDNMKKPSTQIVQQVFLEYDELRPVAEGEANDKWERSKSRNNSKNHHWPSPTRVGIDAPRGEKK